METKYAYLGLGLAFVGGTALGVGAGYRWAMKKYYRAYEEVIEQEIREAKEFYATLYKQDYPTPADAAEALIPDVQLEEATTALRSYLGAEPSIDGIKMETGDPIIFDEPEVEVEVVERNIFDNGEQLKIDMAERDTSKPYVVRLEEYLEHPEGHDEISLTYYSGDGVLGDESDEPIEDVDLLVGRMNLNMFGASDPDDPHILLIRNEQRKLDIEVTFSTGKFAHEVLGFNHSDEPAPMRRPRQRWDDE